MARLTNKQVCDDFPRWIETEKTTCCGCDRTISEGGTWFDGKSGLAICPKCAVQGARPLAQMLADAVLDAGECLDLEAALDRFCDAVRRAYLLGRERELEPATAA